MQSAKQQTRIEEKVGDVYGSSQPTEKTKRKE